MKKTIPLILVIFLVLINCFSSSVLASGEYAPCSDKTENPNKSIEKVREEVRRLFPGLKEIDKKDVDPSLPVIEVNSVEEVANIINSLNSAPLYKRQPDSEKHM